jgi:hypothetical protein
MAVHLNARLKTRFIPYLFTVAVFVIITTALAHATLEVAPDELRAVMDESVDPSRLDRRPGFSEIVVAPRPGERPTTGILSAQNAEEPLSAGNASPLINAQAVSDSPGRYLDFSDELPAQPGEASSKDEVDGPQ